MFDCVPLPVWKTTRGKWSSSFPAITSSAACTISFTVSAGSCFSDPLANAAHFLRMPIAFFTDRPHWKRSTPILKLSRERSVWAPQ